MRRAIELARHGLGNTSPNPMVGAVIVCEGKIIGEGYHRRCGEGHAEVNAVASVADRELLKSSTIYVTLEPCSHYGKTPPCAKLIVDCGIPRVVVGSLDPNEKVSGRGVKMLRDAGIEVITGVLEKECLAINPSFMTAHTLRRPRVTLKWAQSLDGYVDRVRAPEASPSRFSNTVTSLLTHRLRSLNDAIMAGTGTIVADNPSLNVRLWPGRSPLRFVAGRPANISIDSKLLTDGGMPVKFLTGLTPAEMLSELFSQGVTSLLIEGGPTLLQSFIDSGLWDDARVEISPVELGAGIKAPSLAALPSDMITVGTNRLLHFHNNSLS